MESKRNIGKLLQQDTRDTKNSKVKAKRNKNARTLGQRLITLRDDWYS